METGLSTLLSWQFLLFSLGTNVVIFLIRTIIEYFIKNIVTMGFWDKLLLPIAPSITGGLGGFLIKQYPYPDGISSTDARILFGVVAGFLSGLLYQVIKGMLKSRIQSFVQQDGSAPSQQNVMGDRARPDPPSAPQIIPFNSNQNGSQ
jgi:hypothetical protein